MELPIYKLVIDESDDIESGVDFIALVDDPAIERNWQAFNSDKRIRFKVDDEEKRIISGSLMVADLPIFRRDESGKEYYVVFDKEAIKNIVYKFMRNGLNANVNIMHDKGALAEGVYLFESMLIDSERGIVTPDGFDELPNGSWFGSMKVDNDEIWNNYIKTGEFKGFSVEGVFEPVLADEKDEDIIQGIINNING
jgi:hypothetical protein